VFFKEVNDKLIALLAGHDTKIDAGLRSAINKKASHCEGC
jgi:hypothetical protein